MLCIPLNIAIIYFSGDGNVKDGGTSEYIEFFRRMNPEMWTISNLILLAVFVEHGIIFLKIILQFLIPDVPYSVVI